MIDYPSSLKLFEEANEILGYNLIDLCRNGPKTKLDQIIYADAAIFVSAMALIEKLKSEEENFLDRITDAAGFSVGEYCALVVADTLNFKDGK